MAAWCISAQRDVPRLARHPGIAVGVRARVARNRRAARRRALYLRTV
jgi:hypothetical protein